MASRLSGIVPELERCEGISNPFLHETLSFFVILVQRAAAQQTPALGYRLVQAAARMILNIEADLRESVNSSPSVNTEELLEEFFQECRNIEPGYSAVY